MRSGCGRHGAPHAIDPCAADDQRRGTEYVGSTDAKGPVLSPLYADLRGFPPALFVTSGRDLLLSGTTILHRAFLRAGVGAQLVVFEALRHAFWYDYHLPETKEALDLMAKLLVSRLRVTSDEPERQVQLPGVRC